MTTMFAILAVFFLSADSHWGPLFFLLPLASVQSFTKWVMNRQYQSGLSNGLGHEISIRLISDEVTYVNMATKLGTWAFIVYAMFLKLN
jgi:hypothetical protein